MLDVRTAARLLGGEARGGQISAPGPGHSAHDRSLSVRIDPAAPDGFLTHSHAGDNSMLCRDHVRSRLGLPSWRPGVATSPPPVRPPRKPDTADERDTAALAKRLWEQGRDAAGTVAETYLRNRGYSGPIPNTIRFLRDGFYGPCMIAPFGMAEEIEPGVVNLCPQDFRGLHLTQLLVDGSGRLDAPNAKRMLGRGSIGFPIVLAPPNDGLGLAITEGIEDGLAIHEATGLGVWVAGCANRMPALADRIPKYIDALLIVAHPDDSGRKFAGELAQRMKRRGIETEIKILKSERLKPCISP